MCPRDNIAYIYIACGAQRDIYKNVCISVFETGKKLR